MARLRAARLAGALILAATMGTGCAARWAYHQGQAAAEKGNWDLAVARLTRALDKDSKNIGYKIALESARIQASRYHYDQAKKQLAANDLMKAAEELQIASNYDPANRSAADDLALVRKRIRKQEEEQREREDLDQVRARAQALARLPVPVLSPRETAPISMRFEDSSLQKIFETLGKLAAVNVLFDDSFRDKKTSVVLTGLSFQDALERLTMVNRLFYKVLDQNTLIVAAESPQNRRKYDEMLLRTFYLQNAEINETATLVKTVAKVTTVGANKDLGAITVLGSVSQVAMAERIIEANDKPRGEVVVEVQILEVNRTAARNWGLGLSGYAASATLNPTGDPVGDAQGNVLPVSVRAQLLSSLNQADWIVSIPAQIFTQFIQNESTARILAAPRLRSAEGKKAELTIGQEVPIPVTSIGAGIGGTGGGTGYYPATSFQYKNVGVSLGITPRVAASGDVTLELEAEFSLLGAETNIGSKSQEQLVPTFLSRKVKAMLRLRDGETGLMGGLVQGRQSRSFAGALGMDEIPILGKLLGSRSRNVDETEILMSITPHIVRGPKLTEEDLIPLRVGTQEVPRVEGAMPPLFGPPETSPKTGAAAPAAATPTPATPKSAAPTSAAPARPQPTRPQPGAAPAPEGVPTTAPSVPEMPGPVAEAPPEEPAAPAAAMPPPTPASPPSEAPSAAPSGPPAPTPGPPATLLLSPPEVSLRTGQSAGISLVLLGGREVQGVDVTLVFDPALVEVTDVTAGSLLTLDGRPVQTERALEPGRARLRFDRPTPVSGSGGVASITLRGLRPGSGPLAVESASVRRAGATESPAPPAPGRLVVAP